jgi:hypothetical protein
VFGAIANGVITSRLDRPSGAGAVELEDVPVGVLDPALQAVFVAVACCVLLLGLAGLLMPSGRPSPSAEGPATGE